MEYTIRKVKDEELENAFTLIWNTFQEFVAPDYSAEGIKTFRVNYIDSQEFRDCFKIGRQTMYGAYCSGKLVGVLSISSHNNISCVFVDKAYHRKGIATGLLQHIIAELKNKQVEKIALNASPYAVPFYHAIGFRDLDVEKDYHGIRYTPMELKLMA